MKLFTKTLLVSAFIVGINAVDTSVGNAVRGIDDAVEDLLSKNEKNPTQPVNPDPSAAAAKNQNPINEVTYEQVQSAQKDGATIVDALQAGDMIEGAIRIPAKSDDATITKALSKKDAKIIVYCWSASCDAAMTLAMRLLALGYTNVSHFSGGISEWKEKNLPITKG